MNGGGSLGVDQGARNGLGIEKPMIPAFHALSNFGFNPGKGLGQQGLPPGTFDHLTSCEAVSSRGKGLQELLHGPGFPT